MTEQVLRPPEQGEARTRVRLYRTPAIVLRRSDFGEADRLLTVLTPGMGKLRLLAKGVRRPTSRKAGHLELFTHVHLLVAEGRNLDLISQAETIQTFRPLQEDLLRAGHAYYVAELVDRFAQEELENPDLFALFRETLANLAESPNLPLTTRYFELHLLGVTGYQPQLYRCARCHATLEPVTNWFAPGDGGVACPRCGEGQPGMFPMSLPAFKVLRFLQTRPYEVVIRLRLSAPVMAEVEDLLQRYLEYHLERRLESAGFLRRLRVPTLAGKREQERNESLK
ncbi:MAG: DNA repair protein RecO [Anaerolineae bacterium]